MAQDLARSKGIEARHHAGRRLALGGDGSQIHRARLDGKFVVHGNDDTLSVADMALGHKQLQRVEDDDFSANRRSVPAMPGWVKASGYRFEFG